MFKKILLCALAGLSSSFIDADEANSLEAQSTLKPYRAKYIAYYQGDQVGHAVRQFTQLEPNRCQIKMQTYASKLFYSDERDERSDFNCQLLADGQWQVRPLKYQYKVEKTFGDEEAKQSFDWSANQVTGLNDDGKWAIPLNPGTQDRISVYWRLMRDLKPETPVYSYQVSDDGKVKGYEFVLEGQESLTLPYATLQTYKVSRTRSNGKRKTLYWFAPELGNAPVRIQHFKYDELQGDLLLSEFSWLEGTLDN